MEIVSSTRAMLRVAMNGRTITLSGEGMPSGQAVDFYADLASIRSWDDGTPVSADDRHEIVTKLPEVARRKGFKLVID
jgi:hypothetical protein